MAISKPASPRSHFNELLPTEIQGDIFTLIHIHATSRGLPIFSKKHSSVVLSHVCSEWREVALSTPQLWTDLHVAFPRRIIEFCQEHPKGDMHLKNDHSRIVEDKLEFLRCKLVAWLDRSGSLPLTITGMSDTVPNLQHAPTTSQKQLEESMSVICSFDHIRKLIVSSISRWSRIEPPIGYIRTQVCDCTTHILEFLRWTNSTEYIVALAANLQSLRIAVPPAATDKHDICTLTTYKWDALQCLTLVNTHQIEVDDILELLRSCRNLTLDLHRLPKPSTHLYYTGQKTVTLLCLRSITFRDTPPFVRLHEVFDLPVLRSFTLDSSLRRSDTNRQDIDSVYWKSLTDWMKRFGTGLTELNLLCNGDRSSPEEWLLQCLTEDIIPNITHLKTMGRMDPNLLFERLTHGLPSGEPCCPRLQEFILLHNTLFPATLTEKAALDFIVARLATSLGPDSDAPVQCVHKLRYVELEVMDGGKIDVIEELTNRGADLKNVTIKIAYFIKAKGLYRPYTKSVTIDSGILVDTIMVE